MKLTNGSISLLAAALALAGCGGGGGGGGDTAAVTSSGTITGFGSIYVNGVRYRTDRATVEFDDDGLVGADRLRRGMRVTVKGDRNGGEYTARRIEFDAELEGALDDVPNNPSIPDASAPKTGSFTVGGFLVETNENTVFDLESREPQDLTSLSSGDPVEVSAFATATGFRATRVELEDGPIGPGEFEVEGVISDQNFEPGVSFEILGVTIDIRDAVVEGELAPGVLVEVEGSLGPDGVIAAEVEVEDDLFDDAFDDEIELEGVLVRDGDELFVAGHRVRDPDGLLDGVLDGVVVEVELIRIGDRLVVIEAELEVEDTVETEDNVGTVNRDRDSFTTRLGIEIAPRGPVALEDDVRDDDHQITVAEFLLRLLPDDRIEAEGFPSGAGVTWTEIEREESPSREPGCSLQGHVEADFVNPSFKIQGVEIVTTATTEFLKADGITSLTQGEFFSQLSPGKVVDAETDLGTGCNPGRLDAQVVSFEDD